MKVLREECTQHVSFSEMASLQREAEMLQALNHPAIVRLYWACFTTKPVRYWSQMSRFPSLKNKLAERCILCYIVLQTYTGLVAACR